MHWDILDHWDLYTHPEPPSSHFVAGQNLPNTMNISWELSFSGHRCPWVPCSLLSSVHPDIPFISFPSSCQKLKSLSKDTLKCGRFYWKWDNQVKYLQTKQQASVLCSLHITGEIPLAIFLIQTSFPITSQSSFSYLIFIYILLYSLSSLHRTIIISHFLTHKTNNFLVPVNTHAFWVSYSIPIVHQSIILIEVDYLSKGLKWQTLTYYIFNFLNYD